MEDEEEGDAEKENKTKRKRKRRKKYRKEMPSRLSRRRGHQHRDEQLDQHGGYVHAQFQLGPAGEERLQGERAATAEGLALASSAACQPNEYLGAHAPTPFHLEPEQMAAG